MMAHTLLRRASERIAPQTTARLAAQYHAWRRIRGYYAEAKALRRKLDALQDLDSIAELALNSPAFRPSQKKSEIVALLRLLRELQPKCVCEIGSYRGGTLAMFCQVAAPNARIMTIDFNFKPEQLKAFRDFAGPGQQITCLKADSHAVETVEQLKRWLGNHRLDFLFIDGDHSLEGVTQDFELFSPLVRAGGVIALHDIMPDYQTRYGTRTQSFTGGVPLFWAQLKQKWLDAEELIADPEQDGFGIGVINWRVRH